MANFVKTHFEAIFCFFLCALVPIVVIGVGNFNGAYLSATENITLISSGLFFSLLGGIVIEICDGGNQ